MSFESAREYSNVFGRKILTKLADTASLGIMNKIFGAAFGIAKIGLILSVVLIVFNKLNRAIPFVDEQNFEASILYNPVKNFAPMLFPSILQKEEDQSDESRN